MARTSGSRIEPAFGAAFWICVAWLVLVWYEDDASRGSKASYEGRALGCHCAGVRAVKAEHGRRWWAMYLLTRASVDGAQCGRPAETLRTI